MGIMLTAPGMKTYQFTYIHIYTIQSVTDKLDMLSKWAAQFVVWAKEFMKKQTGEKEAETDNATYYKVGQRAAAKGSTVNIYTGYAGTTAVATDNVPDGALEDNPDGSVNVYNETGEKVGTVSAEEAEAAERNVEKIVIEEDGGK